MRPTVLLFDIDGTLLNSGGAGRRAMERAFERRCGRRDACDAIRFGGMTDPAIARAGLTAVGAPVDDEAIAGLLAAYLEALADELPGCHVVVPPGVEAALDAARAAGAAIGLGTGNVRAGADLKLARVGLHERFVFGGFGSDHEARDQLIRVGARRGAEALGVAVDACRVVVIGDTPKDVDAARAIGAESLAVATGTFSVDELAACAPTWTFRDLSDPAAVAAMLGG